MGPIKIMLVVYVAIILLMVSFDLGLYVKANESVKRGLDKAIDSGITLGTDRKDYQDGKLRLIEGDLYNGVRSVFRENMKLNANMSSDVYKNGRLEVSLQYSPDGSPRVVAKFTCDVIMVSGRLVGLDSQPLSVTKITPYKKEYK
ncbi:hypothetical protein ACE41H_24585 [Paenibacillus enshidis]|uniref:Flp pilus-assembly TadG-like N-terminal domain-containing protein n=1 Tax=Paenibacillus enshidis TaxID=1458439 RepID=A0ABV5B0E2_9BACL